MRGRTMKCDEHERLPWLRALMRKPMSGEGVQILLQDLEAFAAQAPDSEIWTFAFQVPLC